MNIDIDMSTTANDYNNITALKQDNKPWYELDDQQNGYNTYVSIKLSLTKHINITIVENQSSSNNLLGNVLWPGGTALSTYITLLITQPYLFSNNEYNLDIDHRLLEDKTVIELGSGVGILGITCAKLGAKSVTMTDMYDCIPLLKQNIKANFNDYDINNDTSIVNIHNINNNTKHQQQCSITACELAWSTDYNGTHTLPVTIQQQLSYDIIIMSDVVYDGFKCNEYGINNYHRLCNTLYNIANEDTIILLQYTKRRTEENIFFDLLSKYFVWLEIPAYYILPTEYCNIYIDNRLIFYSIKKTKYAQTNMFKSLNGKCTFELINYLKKQQEYNNNLLDNTLNDQLCNNMSLLCNNNNNTTYTCSVCDRTNIKHCYKCNECNMFLCRMCDKQYHRPSKYSQHVRHKVR